MNVILIHPREGLTRIKPRPKDKRDDCCSAPVILKDALLPGLRISHLDYLSWVGYQSFLRWEISHTFFVRPHYYDVIMGAMASQITSLTIAYFKRLFRRRSKKTSKLRVTSLCEGNSSVTGEFPAQRSNNAENVSIWWRHHDLNAPFKIHS